MESNIGNVVSFYGVVISVLIALLSPAIVLAVIPFLRKIINSNVIQIRLSKMLFFVFSYMYLSEEQKGSFSPDFVYSKLIKKLQVKVKPKDPGLSPTVRYVQRRAVCGDRSANV